MLIAVRAMADGRGPKGPKEVPTVKCFPEIASWLLSSCGLALLVFSLVLVPQNVVMAQGTPPPGTCPSASLCNNGCHTAACHTAGCLNVLGCNCTALATCGKCKCRYFTSFCQCNS